MKAVEFLDKRLGVNPHRPNKVCIEKWRLAIIMEDYFFERLNKEIEEHPEFILNRIQGEADKAE